MARRLYSPLHGLAPVPRKVSEEDQVLFKGMKPKQPLEKNSLTSQEERDSRSGCCFWLWGTGVASGLLLLCVLGTEEDVL